MTTIELSTEDALLFIEFQKRYALIKALEVAGAFSAMPGKVIIHFDNLGTVRQVDVEKYFKI